MASGVETRADFVIQVQLSDLLHYASRGSRIIVEGERVFKADHLLLVGVQEVRDDGLKLFASCLESSSPSSEQHTIIIHTKTSFEDWLFQCSCKAGQGKCKHVMAVLNHILLHPSIPFLASTDIQQKWGKVAQKVAGDMYKPTLITDFCQKQTVVNSSSTLIPISDEEATHVMNSFLQNFRESSLHYEIYGRPQQRENVENDSTNCQFIDELLHPKLDDDLSSHRLSTDSLISFDGSSESNELKNFIEAAFHNENFTQMEHENMFFIGPLEFNLSFFYELQVSVSVRESIEICCNTVEQRCSPSWKTERTRRITASKAYSLYTYYSSHSEKAKDWRKKILSTVFPKYFQNEAIAHGIRCEPLAIASYMRDFQKTVNICGFVIPPHIPWLGCSPDGIVIAERKIIEIKCPLIGKYHSIDENLEKLTYLTKSSKRLKKNHRYYTQVQLNMFILKSFTTDFIIYSELEDKCNVETIHFDEDYIRTIFSSLKEVYFNVFLKYLYSSQSRNL